MIQQDARTHPHIAPSPSRQPGRQQSAYRVAVIAALSERRTVMNAAYTQLVVRADALAQAAACILSALRLGHKALIAGNGGSAAEAQHLAGELVGRFQRERAPFAALALTTDTAILTAIANDYGYEEVFARQVRALAQPGDVFIGLSTSGASPNVLRAARACHERGVAVIAITGERPNALARMADIALRMPTLATAATQELHLAMIHILCDIVETELAESAEDAADAEVARP
jgi:D-sedoheptulose 7-phosphate isomerase